MATPVIPGGTRDDRETSVIVLTGDSTPKSCRVENYSSHASLTRVRDAVVLGRQRLNIIVGSVKGVSTSGLQFGVVIRLTGFAACES